MDEEGVEEGWRTGEGERLRRGWKRGMKEDGWWWKRSGGQVKENG